MKKIFLFSLLGLGLLTGCQSMNGETADNTLENSSNETYAYEIESQEKEIVSEAIIHNSYASETDPKTLFNESTDSFEAKIIAVHPATVDEFGGIMTPLELEIINQYKGEPVETLIVYQTGGIANVSTYKENVKDFIVEKMRLNEIPQNKEATSYIKEVPEDYAEPVEGQEYLFFVNRTEEGSWISSNAYGMLERTNDTYVNKSTNEIFQLEDIIEY